MDAATLQRQFGIPGALVFDEDRGLTRLRATTPAAQATMYLQGAHLTHWQPAGAQPVLFLSSRSEFAPGKPIRGGIPVVFPWFATDRKPDRVDGHPGPGHGFARIQDWTLQQATLHAGDVALTLTLGPTAMSRSMGFDGFLLTLDITLGAALDLRLMVENRGSAPLQFEEAFHAYFRVADIHEATVTGLEAARYLDKTDAGAEKPASGEPIAFTQTLDRVYLNTATACTIHDGAQRRSIHLVKTGSQSTVVWNPWKASADIGEWDWHEMLALETANVGPQTRTLQPGATSTMAMHVTLGQRAGSEPLL